MAGKQKGPKPAVRRGRPPVEIKKKPFQVMLDPRYIDHFRKVAGQKSIQPQDLARIALNALIPDPYNPLMASSDLAQSLSDKKKEQIAVGLQTSNK